jgi:hypothetical protein
MNVIEIVMQNGDQFKKKGDFITLLNLRNDICSGDYNYVTFTDVNSKLVTISCGGVGWCLIS